MEPIKNKDMGLVIFKDGIYKAKTKEESEILLSSLYNGYLYKDLSSKEVEEKFNKIVIENRKKRNGSQR